MIDIESAVFERVRTAVREVFLADYPDLTVLNDRPETQQHFPCVVLVQDDNTPYARAESTVATEERYASVTFTLEVYTAETAGGKTLAKKIADVADKTLFNLNFSRRFFRETPNADRKLKRFTGRYSVIVEKLSEAEGEDGVPILDYMLYRR